MIVRSSKLTGYQIKKIIECFVIDIDASKTSLIVKVNRKTVNRFFGLFRKLIWQYQKNEFEKVIGGIAECDESYFGGRRRRGVPGKRGRGTSKQPVFGIFERNGRVYTEIIPNCKKKTLLPIIQGKVSPETIIYTDKWRSYASLVSLGYDKHKRLNHQQGEFSDGKGGHINGIENFWSFTKRRLAKFNGVKVNFKYHLKECEWRYEKTIEGLESHLVVLLKRSYQSSRLLV